MEARHHKSALLPKLHLSLARLDKTYLGGKIGNCSKVKGFWGTGGEGSLDAQLEEARVLFIVMTCSACVIVMQVRDTQASGAGQQCGHKAASPTCHLPEATAAGTPMHTLLHTAAL